MLLRLEDVLLVASTAVVAPLLHRLDGESGLFVAGQPVRGVVDIAAVVCAAVCLAARRRDDDANAVSIVRTGAVGPLTGGMLLVAISGGVALSLPSAAVFALLLGTATLMLVVHTLVPPLGALPRRALVLPFVLVCSQLFWSLVEQFPFTPAASLFVVVFSAVFYAMLVYAPRQVAEHEGGLLSWLLRYAAFCAAVLLGLSWLRVLSG